MKTIEQIQRKDCRTRTTLRSGTVMESSNLSFRDWFIAMHLMTSTKKDISAMEMQRQLGFKRYEPVWFMMQKIRVAMGTRDERYELSEFTEMDEGYFTTVESVTVGEKDKKSKRGRGSEKQTPVLVMAQTEYIKNPKHLPQVIPPDQAGKELPWVHIAISNAKRNLLNNFHHVDDTYLQNYLDEFTYRLNRRYTVDKLFGRLLIICISFCWII